MVVAVNQTEIWFGIITRQSIRRGTCVSVTVLTLLGTQIVERPVVHEKVELAGHREPAGEVVDDERGGAGGGRTECVSR